jgi:hypothetical protein
MPDEIRPYEARAQAHAAAVAAIPPGDGLSVLSAEQNRELLTRALQDAGVPVGAHGEEVIGYLAGLTDDMCEEIASWVRPPAGTVTEWGVRFNVPPGCGRDALQPYGTEDEARYQAAITPDVDGWSATLMSHQVGPWTEAPERAQDGSDA